MGYSKASIEIPASDMLACRLGNRTPETVVQAVMEAAPHQDPAKSHEEISSLTELIYVAIDDMPKDERLLLEAVIFERLSFRQLEVRFKVSKSEMHRLYVAALLKLRGRLIEYPQIVQYLDSKEIPTQ